ncbi:hypothetical protein NST37_09095 [Brevibacillus sp. FSL K6-6036]|jgi:hypothetical protein
MMLENKSVYYVTSWDDAAVYTRALEAMNIPHAVESPGSPLDLSEGQLAIVLPHLPARTHSKVRELFQGEGERYPD